ncbi:hypothetical protein H6F52_17570 [Coleofasciculus sp. FACHB-542]|nr:hypothetical protein [Coleofasciculus sp. FACHB-542]
MIPRININQCDRYLNGTVTPQASAFRTEKPENLAFSPIRLRCTHKSADLSPNPSPTPRWALNTAPLPYEGRGWGLGLRALCPYTVAL